MRAGSEAQILTSVVTQLREIERLSGWARTCAIGELVLQKLFGGSVQNWRTKTHEGNQSLRRLAAHPDCPLKKSALAEAIAIYVFVRENPAVRDLANIAPGHVALVHRHGQDQALALLREAEVQSLGVKALARSLAVGGTARVGVPRSASVVLKRLREIERSLQSLVQRLKLPDVWARLEEEQVNCLLNGVRRQLAELEGLFRRFRCEVEGGTAITEIRALSPVRGVGLAI